MVSTDGLTDAMLIEMSLLSIPSIKKLLSDCRLPATLNPPRSTTAMASPAGNVVVAGARIASWENCRPFNGNSTIFCVSMTLPTVAVALILLCCLFTSAQNITGTIQGIITDPSGAILPGVSVTVHNLRTNQTRNVLTNETGTYIVPLLPVGTYEVTAEYTGFKTQIKS